MLECCELLKERSSEIKWSSKFLRIPPIAEPRIAVVDGERLIRRKIRDDLLSCQIALAMIELPLIAMRKTALSATVLAEGGGREGNTLSSERRRDFLVEGEIVLRDFKRR